MFHRVKSVLHNVFQQLMRLCEIKLDRESLWLTLCNTV